MEATTTTVSAEKLKIFRREQSLRSQQYRGVLVRVVYEGDSLEILRTEMEPGSALDDHEIGIFPVIHFIIDGSPTFVVANQCGDLMPGDSIVLRSNEQYRISNPASSRSVILSILFKDSEQEKGGGQ
jgi:mannose-6-phosphate isomerase-like protein (cupin superfamily)